MNPNNKYLNFFSVFVIVLLLCAAPQSIKQSSSEHNPVPPQAILEKPVTDADGNTYTTVKIGNQIWTVENLRTTKYNDSTPINEITDITEWRKTTAGALCYYNNNYSNNEKYGALYNWYAVNSGKLAPSGWRVPHDSDWVKLEQFLIKNWYNSNGTKAGNRIGKPLAAKSGWMPYRSGGCVGSDLWDNNSTGFAALPSGYRYINGDFFSQREIGLYWSATEDNSSYAWDRHIGYDANRLYRESRHKNWGLSVRLVRDSR